MRDGVKRTVGGEERSIVILLMRNVRLVLYVCMCLYVFTFMVLLTTTPRILSGHSEGRPGGDVSLLIIQVDQIFKMGRTSG